MDSGDKQVQPHSFRFTKPEAGDFPYLPALERGAAPGSAPGGWGAPEPRPARPLPAPPSPVTCRSGPGSCALAPRAPHGCSASALVILRGAAASADCGARPPAPPPARPRCDRPPGSGLAVLRAAAPRLLPCRVPCGVAIPLEPETRTEGSERRTPGSVASAALGSARPGAVLLAAAAGRCALASARLRAQRSWAAGAERQRLSLHPPLSPGQ